MAGNDAGEMIFRIDTKMINDRVHAYLLYFRIFWPETYKAKRFR